MPARVIRAEINASESLSRVTEGAELMFRALLLAVDDFGRLDARPKILKAELFPLRDSMTTERIEELLGELHSDGCVQRYEVGGRPYVALTGWEKHRANGKRATSSKFPEPPGLSTDFRGSPGDPWKSENPQEIHPSDDARGTTLDARGTTLVVAPRAAARSPAAPAEWALQAAAGLRQSVRRRWPGAPVPESIVAWARELERIRAPAESVAELVAWYAHADQDATPFLPECRSGRSFREKYDRVLAARQRAEHPPPASIREPPKTFGQLKAENQKRAAVEAVALLEARNR